MVKSKAKLFPLEKILTASASDYCTSTGRNLRDYKLVGVNFEGADFKTGKFFKTIDSKGHYEFLLNNLSSRVPEGTEVITDFRFSHGGVGYAYGLSGDVVGYSRYTELRSLASGTALIRRSKKKK